MEPNNNSIITEDGQRLTVKDGKITGTEDPGPGLAYETGNILEENNSLDNEKGKLALPITAQTIMKIRNEIYPCFHFS
jgi:hypothetical protein